MILKGSTGAKRWSPRGFHRFAELFPATGWASPAAHDDLTAQFVDAWRDDSPSSQPVTDIVLTPGLFAEWLPTAFGGARRAFRRRGYRVLKTPVRTARTVREQAETLARQVRHSLSETTSFAWCTHSKGGLDALWALRSDPVLRQRCAFVVAVQVPVGHSWVVERWLRAPGSLRERAMGRLLRGRQFAGGIRDVSLARDVAVRDWLAAFETPVPLVHVVSWSTRPTSWLDSYHRELNAMRPGVAHDGQFYLADQRLPGVPVVCLPELDHAQPVLGGFGLDVGRLWLTLLEIGGRVAAQTR